MDKSVKYYKILNEWEYHDGMQYWNCTKWYDILSAYVDAGIDPNKLHISESPVCTWSLTRMCIVGHRHSYLPEALELVERSDGSKWLTVENNRFVILQTRAELSPEEVKRINQSNGIICTGVVSDKSHFRYALIPTE